MSQTAQRNSVFFTVRTRILESESAPHRKGDAALDAEGRLAYYASPLPGRETWFQTPEGYRIYKNATIARTGSQVYIGREIKKNSGYKASWNIGDDDSVTVYRPLDEVTSPETIASFEMKSVLDEHPEGDKVLIDALDELDGYTKGHGQNVRVGDKTSDGDTTLIADVVVKHPELNDKVENGAAREISCGYTFVLDKAEDGTYIQTKIRGNHIAIVPRGRAGSEVGIRDSAPAPTNVRRNTMSKPATDPTKRTFRSLLIGLGFQNWAKDAKPEDINAALDEMSEEEKSEREAKDKKGAKDAGHPEGCRCKDCSSARDAEPHPESCKCKDCMGAKDEKGDDKDLEDVDEKRAEKDKKGAKDDAEILPAEDTSKTLFSVGDAAAGLKRLRPIVARSKDPEVRTAFNKLAVNLRAAQDGVKDGKPDPFAALTHISADAVADADVEIPMWAFFNGKPYADGLKSYNEYTQARLARGK